jgi:hypothetical protein
MQTTGRRKGANIMLQTCFCPTDKHGQQWQFPQAFEGGNDGA